MMLSTIAKSRPLLTQISAFAFAETSSHQTSPLNQQILQTKSWKEFLKLFTDKKQEFNQDTFNFASRYVNHLISRQSQFIRYSEFSEIIKVIEELDTSTMTQTHVISLLALLRIFCYKGVQINTISKLKYRLCSRFTELFEAKPEGKENLTELLNAYYEMVFFNWVPGTRMVSERILNRFKIQGQNSRVLTLSQSQYLLNALSKNEDLSNQQRRLRNFILKDISERIDQASLSDLVNMMVSINKMKFHDGMGRDFYYVKTIGNKIVQNMSELEEKSIFQLLRGINRSQHPIFKTIYDDLFRNIFAEISEDGSSSVDSRLMLKLFSGLSARCNFYKYGQTDKNKVHTFLNRCVEQFTTNNDTDGIKVLRSCFQNVVQYRFYDQNKNQQIVDALLKLGTPMRQKVLELLYINKADIMELIPAFLAQGFSEKSYPATVFRYSTFIRKLIANQKYQAQKQALESYLSHFTQKLDEAFSSPLKFCQTFGYLFKNQQSGINLQLFHIMHEEYFKRLPNPFEAQIEDEPNNYKSNYLQYVLYSFRQNDAFKFLSTYNTKISNATISRVIYFNNQQQNNPNKYLVYLAARNISQAVQSKEKEFISSALQLVSRYCRFVVPNDRDVQITRNTLKILGILFEKIQALRELNQNRMLQNVFIKYIERDSGNYRNEFFYRDLVVIGLRYLKKLSNFSASQVLKQALRLNLVQQKYIDNLQFQKLNALNYLEKQSLLYLRDHTSKPDIKTLTVTSLPAIFFNHNLQSFIQSKQTQINEVLEKSNVNDLLGYLTVFNQPRTGLSNRIITKILGLIVSSSQYIERGNFLGAIQNLLDKNWSNSKMSKEFAQKVVTLLSIKAEQFSLNTHYEAIRFAISIPTYNPQGYYKKLADYTRRNYRDIDFEQLLFRLAFTNYEFRPEQLKHVRSLLKKNTYRGIYLFLATESQHSEAERKQLVSQIVQKLTTAKETDSSIQYIQYDYLKNTYPQETKDLQLKPEQLQKGAYFSRPNQKVAAVLQQIAKANQTTLEVVPDFEQNYLARINNVVIGFYNVKRTGSYHEHQFLRRALPLHFKEEKYQYIFIGPSSVNRIPDFIEKQAPQIMTPQVKQAVSILIERNRPEKTQSEEHDQENHQPKSQNRQNRERKPRQPKNDQN